MPDVILSSNNSSHKPLSQTQNQQKLIRYPEIKPETKPQQHYSIILTTPQNTESSQPSNTRISSSNGNSKLPSISSQITSNLSPFSTNLINLHNSIAKTQAHGVYPKSSTSNNSTKSTKSNLSNFYIGNSNFSFQEPEDLQDMTVSGPTSHVSEGSFGNSSNFSSEAYSQNVRQHYQKKPNLKHLKSKLEASNQIARNYQAGNFILGQAKSRSGSQVNMMKIQNGSLCGYNTPTYRTPTQQPRSNLKHFQCKLNSPLTSKSSRKSSVRFSLQAQRGPIIKNGLLSSGFDQIAEVSRENSIHVLDPRNRSGVVKVIRGIKIFNRLHG